MSVEMTPTPGSIDTAPLGEAMAFSIDGQQIPPSREAAARALIGFLFPGHSEKAQSPESYIQPGSYESDLYGGGSMLYGMAVGYTWEESGIRAIATSFEANFRPDGFWAGIVKYLKGKRPQVNVFVIPMLRGAEDRPDGGTRPLDTPPDPDKHIDTRPLVGVS